MLLEHRVTNSLLWSFKMPMYMTGEGGTGHGCPRAGNRPLSLRSKSAALQLGMAQATSAHVLAMNSLRCYAGKEPTQGLLAVIVGGAGHGQPRAGSRPHM